MDTADLIDRYCQAWSEPDADHRAELLASVWEPTATYTDPSVYAVGTQALLTHIATMQAARSGAQVLRTSAVDRHHALVRFTWHVVQANGTELREGLDIAFLSPDSTKIERMVGFFGPLSAEPR